MNTKTSAMLTLIISCYNAEKYIERCVASLENLNASDVELLFVNDGSCDNTVEMLTCWIKKHTNAKMISKENGGYSSAVNVGLDNCGTEYVMFMGVDDELVPEKISEICQHLKENKPDILAFSTIKCFDDSENKNLNEIDILTMYAHPGYYEDNIADLTLKIGGDTRILFTRDTSRCYKMEAIRDLRYFGKIGISADGCFSSLVACQSNSFEFVNMEAYLWHVHRDSVSGRNKTHSKMLEEAEVWKQYFEVVISAIDKKRITDYVVNQLFVYGELIKKLDRSGEINFVVKHKLLYRQCMKWLRHNNALSNKSKIKVFLPFLYSILRLKKRSINRS